VVENRRRQLEACSRTLAPSPPPATPVRVQLRPPQTPRDASAYPCGLRLQRKDESWVPPLHPSVAPSGAKAHARRLIVMACAHAARSLVSTVAASTSELAAGPVPCQCRALPAVHHSARQCSDSTVSPTAKAEPLQVLGVLLWPVEIVRRPLALLDSIRLDRVCPHRRSGADCRGLAAHF
jgi:hypothetical protein